MAQDTQRLIDRLGSVFARSTVALTLADLREDDHPLSCVNPSFCQATGYDADEAVGRNCRFLQPPGGAGPVRQSMRRFLADPAQDNARFVVPNRRKDGTPFINLVYMAKLHRDRRPAFILGSQFAVTENKRTGDLYDRALRENVQQIRDLFEGSEWTLLGSTEAVAGSMALIARHHAGQDSA